MLCCKTEELSTTCSEGIKGESPVNEHVYKKNYTCIINYSLYTIHYAYYLYSGLCACVIIACDVLYISIFRLHNIFFIICHSRC